jgi:hypothetical protein
VEKEISVLVTVVGFPCVVRVDIAVCVNLIVVVLSAWTTVLVPTEVALITEVLRTGLGVYVIPSLPATKIVEVLVTSGAV